MSRGYGSDPGWMESRLAWRVSWSSHANAATSVNSVQSPHRTNKAANLTVAVSHHPATPPLLAREEPSATQGSGPAPHTPGPTTLIPENHLGERREQASQRLEVSCMPCREQGNAAGRPRIHRARTLVSLSPHPLTCEFPRTETSGAAL